MIYKKAYRLYFHYRKAVEIEKVIKQQHPMNNKIRISLTKIFSNIFFSYNLYMKLIYANVLVIRTLEFFIFRYTQISQKIIKMKETDTVLYYSMMPICVICCRLKEE